MARRPGHVQLAPAVDDHRVRAGHGPESADLSHLLAYPVHGGGKDRSEARARHPAPGRVGVGSSGSGGGVRLPPSPGVPARTLAAQLDGPDDGGNVSRRHGFRRRLLLAAVAAGQVGASARRHAVPPHGRRRRHADGLCQYGVRHQRGASTGRRCCGVPGQRQRTTGPGRRRPAAVRSHPGGVRPEQGRVSPAPGPGGGEDAETEHYDGGVGIATGITAWHWRDHDGTDQEPPAARGERRRTGADERGRREATAAQIGTPLARAIVIGWQDYRERATPVHLFYRSTDRDTASPRHCDWLT